jgi:hypothetical protein
VIYDELLTYLRREGDFVSDSAHLRPPMLAPINL